MDPHHSPSTLITHHSTRLSVAEPYEIYSLNSKVAPDYGQCLQQIETFLNGNFQIRQFSWRWFNNMKGAQINKLIQLLPKELTKLTLSGSFHLTADQFLSIATKLVNLQCLNLYCELDGCVGYFGWDLDYQINIRNSMKNFKQSQKWCYLISQNSITFSNQILPRLPSKMKNLSLRNIGLGKNPKSIRTILECCPQLQYLDLGMTQITDSNFNEVSSSALEKFASSIVQLKLDCNRITDSSIQAIFPGLLSNKDLKENQCYPNLRLLDISKTNIVNSMRFVSKKLPNLVSIALGSLEVQESQVIEACQVIDSKLQQIAVEYVTLSALSMSSLLSISTCLHSLTLSYIEGAGSQKQHSIFSEQILGPNLKRINFNYNPFLTGAGCFKNMLKNASNLEVLKISGTYANHRDVLDVVKCCPKLKWFQISFLKQAELETRKLESKPQTLVEEEGEEKDTALDSFMYVVDSLNCLQYVEAYEFLSKTEIAEFKKRSTPAKVVFVLDSEGPFTLDGQKLK